MKGSLFCEAIQLKITFDIPKFKLAYKQEQDICKTIKKVPYISTIDVKDWSEGKEEGDQESERGSNASKWPALGKAASGDTDI